MSEPEDLTEATLEAALKRIAAEHAGEKIFLRPNRVTWFEDGRFMFREVPDSEIYKWTEVSAWMGEPRPKNPSK